MLQLAGQKAQRAARLLRWMVLRLLTHKVFIEVSLSAPTGFAIFGCPPLPFAHLCLCLFSARKSAITNRKQQQQQRVITTKGATSWQPFRSAVFIFHSLCALSSPYPFPIFVYFGFSCFFFVAPTFAKSCCWLFILRRALQRPLSSVEWPSFHWFACYLLHQQHLPNQWCTSGYFQAI